MPRPLRTLSAATGRDMSRPVVTTLPPRLLRGPAATGNARATAPPSASPGRPSVMRSLRSATASAAAAAAAATHRN